MALDDIGVITALGGAARTRGWHEGAYDIGVRSDGRIVLAGQSYRHADGSDVNRVAVVVLDPGGSPVTPVITPDLRSSTDEWATGLVIDGADRAVLAGLTRQGPTPR